MEKIERSLVHIQESISLYENAVRNLSSDENFNSTSPVFQASFLKMAFEFKKKLIEVYLESEEILKKI